MVTGKHDQESPAIIASDMQLIDIGANLGHESFRPDFHSMLARAREHGVVQMMVTGADAAGSRIASAIAAQYPGFLYATAGVHPHWAVDYDDATDALLRELADQPIVKAVGETGLDYHRNISPPSAQVAAFNRQLQIAVDNGKPLFLHQRDAHDDFIISLDRVRSKVGPVVVHCFTGNREELIDYLDRDCHVGITGWICDERRGHHLKDIVGLIPENRLMIETDSPYLMPRDLVPKPSHRRNEPMYLAHICAAVAAARGESADHVAAITTRNARDFFGLPEPD